MSDSQDVLYEVKDHIATITFNRPDRMNAHTEASEILFLTLLQRADEDPDVRVVIITGTGDKGFCPGADKEYLQAVGDSGGWQNAIPRPMCRFALSVRKPVIAAINGACAGSGLVYALMADIRFASSTARFSTAFVRRGLVGERGTTWLLNHLVGTGVARDLMLSGRKFDATEAAEIGLVNRVVEPDQLMEVARAWAKEVVEYCSPSAMMVIKQQLARDAQNDLEDSLADSGRLGIERMSEADFFEGIAALQEKRLPAFEPVGGPNPEWSPSDLAYFRPGPVAA
jgi:enoyl-CoA hydratase/carnithine racemase